MIMNNKIRPKTLPSVKVYVHINNENIPDGWESCIIGENLKFNIKTLATYFYKDQDDLAYDAFMVAAAIEYCDYSKIRPEMGWGREFTLSIPVENPKHWQSEPVYSSLISVLNLLTGDKWHIIFRPKDYQVEWPTQITLDLAKKPEAIIAFSDGMDSLSVVNLMKAELGSNLVPIRLGTRENIKNAPFVAVPYKIKITGKKRNKETSGRSRGFKFAILSSVASHLSRATRIIIPESGQGALGPALVPLSRIPKDLRNHPSFFQAMEKFISSLFEISVNFEIPRLWNTKGETLREYVDLTNDFDSWKETRSCWRDSRWTSPTGTMRQCGVCAACLLRRMSVHAAQLTEPNDQYVWQNLSASVFEEGAVVPFSEIKGKKAYMRYAKAGVSHLSDMAKLRNNPYEAMNIEVNAGQIARALGQAKEEVMSKQNLLLEKHEHEWNAFLNSLASNSFVTKWAKIGDRNAT
jgi:hypothetical protein